MKKLLFVFIASFLLVIVLVLTPMSKNLYHSAVSLLPKGMQSDYIGFVLSQNKGFFRTNYTKVQLLKMLIDDAKLNFENVILIPLCKRGEFSLDEPIPQMATNIILKTNINLVPKLLNHYADDPVTLEILKVRLEQFEALTKINQ